MPLDPITTVLGLTAMSPPNYNNIAASITPVILMAANPFRKQVIIFNDSQVTLYVKMGVGVVSNSNFTFKIPKQGYYEMPAPIFLGDIKGIWDTAIGFVKITEFV